MADPENRAGVAILVAAPRQTAKSVRVNVTLPEDVLTEVDRYAESHGLTRSGFLLQAAQTAMRENSAGGRAPVSRQRNRRGKPTKAA